MKKIVFAFSVFAALMMSACHPETRNEMLGIPEGAIQLSTENFVSNDTKTAVSGTSVVWVGGEDVDMYVGDEGSKQTRSVVVSEGNAYIASGLTGTGDIRGYYPSGLATANQNSNPTVVLPAEYSCSVSSGRQVIDLPMVGKAESGATSIKFKHLTAAVNVMLKNSLGSDLYVDSTIVIADEYNLNYAGGKTVIFSYSDLNISASTMGATDAKKRVKVYFPSAFTIPTGSSDKCIQVPIMPIGVDSLTIKVYCHSASASYVYSYKEKISTAIARNEVLTARVDLNLKANGGHMDVYIPDTFNPYTTPLTFEARETNATVTYIAPTSGVSVSLQYSTDGSTWNDYTSGTAMTLESAGDKISFRGNNTALAANTWSPQFGFVVTKSCYVYGNIMSLLSKENFSSMTELSYGKTFAYLFGTSTGNSSIYSHDTKALVLPATTLTENCYTNMFKNCSKLARAPELPATTLASTCYSNMFNGCSSLKNVTCLAIGEIGTSNTGSWLNGVSSTGTFTKADGATWTSGTSGIPSNWTVKTAE